LYNLSGEKFISFICFIFQFKFKVLNIEDISQKEKDKQRDQLCTVLVCILENCEDSNFYYYPIRALAEFYTEKNEERLLGKRLKSENLMFYKHLKEQRGRTYMLIDFKKK